MSDALAHYALEESVAVIRLDDGKANALSYAVLEELNTALDRAQGDDAKAVALIGREGRFSAGFDLSVMSQGVEKAVALVSLGAKLALRLYESPVPVVVGATGHALAMGAVLLLSVDLRVGADGPFKVGLNEVAIGMTLPEFALGLARDRLSRRHFYRATSNAEIYSPRDAIDAGFLDRIVPPAEVATEAIRQARTLGETLHAAAHRNTKHALRGPLAEQLRAGLG